MVRESDKSARDSGSGIAAAILLLGLIVIVPPARGQAKPESGAAPQNALASTSREPKAEDYFLSPETRRKAIEYSHTRYALYFLGVALSLAIYVLAWRLKLGVSFRNWARRLSRRHFVQTLAFVPLFLAAVSLAQFPLDYYSGFVVEHRFNLATQTFASWLADWGKGFAISALFLVFLTWVLYLIIRHSPRRWWFYFWLFTIPVTLGVILLQPVIVDPLFFKFTPLENTRPELATRIEAMLSKSGLDIPRQRIFEMNASSKTKTVNAYVTGLSRSKRLVIWDNTIEKLTPDETLLVVGHETGHYALGHIPKMFVLIELVSLIFIYLGFVAVEKSVARWGAPTGLEGVGDLASLPVLFLALTVVSFLASPAIGAISRHYEHQADQYGLELAYGTVPDPNAADARSFRVLGQEDLADPDPSPFIKFWLYTHPPLEDRIRFALSYKPWAEGKPLELVHSGQ
ncbi:MAG TPA: M48 family metallopeptidase [Terriglobia bacterium]|nr:M48 family metallopeptidase [Terriglobia bacterium]